MATRQSAYRVLCQLQRPRSWQTQLHCCGYGLLFPVLPQTEYNKLELSAASKVLRLCFSGARGRSMEGNRRDFHLTFCFHSELCRNLSALLSRWDLAAPCVSPKYAEQTRTAVTGHSSSARRAVQPKPWICASSQSWGASQLLEGWETERWGNSLCTSCAAAGQDAFWSKTGTRQVCLLSVCIPCSPCLSTPFISLCFSPVFHKQIECYRSKIVPLLH